MPSIKVVSNPVKSPLLDIVIDLEETVSPLTNSRNSVKNVKPSQPHQASDREDPAQSSDEESVPLKVVPVDDVAEKDRS